MKTHEISTLIRERIHVFRGHRVMLGSDLAELYGVAPKTLNQAVKRNIKRFPLDFMFPLTPRDVAILKSQIVTSRWGGARRAPPNAFTEQGVAMLSSVLRSDRAIQTNVAIIRTFVKLRELVQTHADLARRLDQLERKYDVQFKVVFDAIRELTAPIDPSIPRPIGFREGEP
jgi:hypothetical protein